MEIYKVNGKHFSNKNLALLEGVKQNHAIITIEVNDTKEFYIERCGYELALIDDDGNDYVCECDFYLEDFVVDYCPYSGQQEIERYFNYENIQIERKPIEHFNLDEKTIQQINHEFYLICQIKDEEI